MNSDWWRAPARPAEPMPPAVSQVLASVEPTNWVDSMLGTETLRTDEERRHFQGVLAQWQRRTAGYDAVLPTAPADKPGAVRINEFGRLLGKPTKVAVVGAGLFGILALLGPPDSELWTAASVSLYLALVLMGISIALRVATHSEARQYRRQVSAAQQADRRYLRARGRAYFAPRALPPSPEGRIAVAAAKVAGDIERSVAWHDPSLDSIHFRIDLNAQVRGISQSAYELHRLREHVTNSLPAELAEDSDIRAAYNARVAVIDRRVEALGARLGQLVAYRDRLRELDLLILKRRWFDEQLLVDDSDAHSRVVLDEFATAEMRSAVDEVDSQARAAMEFLVSDARRIATATLNL